MPQSKETNGHIDADQAKVARTQNRDIIIVTFHPQTLIEPCSKPFTETFKYRTKPQPQKGLGLRAKVWHVRKLEAVKPQTLNLRERRKENDKPLNHQA